MSLHVAMQLGPSLHPNTRMSDVWPLRIPAALPRSVFPADCPHRMRCHCVRSTARLSPSPAAWRVRFAPRRSSTGCSEIPANSRISLRQRFHLRTVHLLRLITEGWGWLPTLHVAMQFGLSHRQFGLTSGVQSLRISRSLEIFPADRPHLSLCHRVAVAQDPRGSQQIARFCSRNYNGLVIVTAAVHRGFSSSLAALPLTFRHWAGVSPYT
jgi:hypothetical protein